MHKFDFLSGAPKTLIFEKESNKTNLGGVLTLLYLIIVILIIAYYSFDYSANDKYSVSYRYEHQFIDIEDDKFYFFIMKHPNSTKK